MATIVICNKEEQVIVKYQSSIIPRKGELIHMAHHGAFRILEVAYRIADDTWDSTPLEELLMYIEVIIDYNNPIK